ncbi:chloride channel protein EriC [Jonquetella anthropi DSM 22815]|uniref:Chloride channel protein EriC n=1 Tax=Jonquetella anthropi DSM 22815 TaxID=885272 RepID=H0UKM5_9BACT|nr:chloride channel protein [Jonquetella anthropi]EHM13234.1 chloride channel protein EriC [Jonquetella anthropi DSM 22815]
MAERRVRLGGELAVMTYAFVKWVVLAVLAGVFVGAGSSGFVWMLRGGEWISELIPQTPRLLLLFVGFSVSTYLIQKYAPDAKGHGTEKVIEAIHEKNAVIDVKVIPVKLAATVVTLSCGGSAGKEGPAAQIGAGIMSVFAQKFKFSEYDRKRLVVCGVSAGFAAIFGTPVAGAVFGIEVLFVGQMFYDVLFPSFISGMVSWLVSGWLGIVHPSYVITSVEAVTPGLIGCVILAGWFFGLVALLNVEIMGAIERAFSKVQAEPIVKALVGALLVALLALIVGNEYLGLGTVTLDSFVAGTAALPKSAFFWKMVFTAITLGCGGSGGVVTPIFFIGASAGAAFASTLGLDVPLFAGLGLVATLAGCANTPIAATFLGIELFGAAMGPLAALASVAAFLTVGHRGIYPSQRLARSKSPLIELSGDVERVDSPIGIFAADRSPVIMKIASFFKSRSNGGKN